MIHKIFSVLCLLVIMCSFACAQEDEEMAPPKPLDDEMLKWMVGKWEGWSESPMGKTKDYQECKMSLDGQFLEIHYKSEMADGNTFSGVGYLTVDKNGQIAGFWVDSFRSMSVGKGRQEGNKSVMDWSMDEGKHTRTMEKIDENKFRVNVLMVGKDGKEMKATSEMTRVEG